MVGPHRTTALGAAELAALAAASWSEKLGLRRGLGRLFRSSEGVTVYAAAPGRITPGRRRSGGYERKPRTPGRAGKSRAAIGRIPLRPVERRASQNGNASPARSAGWWVRPPPSRRRGGSRCFPRSWPEGPAGAAFLARFALGLVLGAKSICHRWLQAQDGRLKTVCLDHCAAGVELLRHLSPLGLLSRCPRPGCPRRAHRTRLRRVACAPPRPRRRSREASATPCAEGRR